MRIPAINCFLIINVAYSENYPLKIKTLPDFPEGNKEIYIADYNKCTWKSNNLFNRWNKSTYIKIY